MLALAIAWLLAAPLPSHGEQCTSSADDMDIAAGLAAIGRGDDPCGESAELVRIVEQFRRCRNLHTRVCVDRTSGRNATERSAGGDAVTITWNPALRSELEWGCAGDLSAPVRRDPTASLLHEIAHAAQACAGEDFDEVDAVRIENIYRRANGLCQRTRYGEELLPPHMLVACEPTRCSCEPAAPIRQLAVSAAVPFDGPRTAGDLAEERMAGQ